MRRDYLEAVGKISGTRLTLYSIDFKKLLKRGEKTNTKFITSPVIPVILFDANTVYVSNSLFKLLIGSDAPGIQIKTTSVHKLIYKYDDMVRYGKRLGRMNSANPILIGILEDISRIVTFINQ